MFNLGKMEKEWTLSEECKTIFDQLKKRFCTAPILKHFDPTLKSILETHASDFVVSGILGQKQLKNDNLVLHPVGNIYEKISPAEFNYEIGHKELLAIFASLEK